MKELSGTVTSKGQLVIPAELRRKHKIKAGTRVHFQEDQFGRIVLQPITDEYIERLRGCLSGSGSADLFSTWLKERREEGKREKW